MKEVNKQFDGTSLKQNRLSLWQRANSSSPSLDTLCVAAGSVYTGPSVLVL